MEEKGIVKLFNEVRGWGFITRENGEEILVRFSEIRPEESPPILRQGDYVSFEVAHGRDGLEAKNVTLA
ncbi:MAG: cold-shock protein [Bacteroidia bacterium]